MAKIKQLPPHEAQKIAAGEVVERPANVVKELMENALDAGATEITLYLEDGGRTLIRIIDNGAGMSEEDARLCILHHATSKITSVKDLESLQTFGFRGEALSSIASVCLMTLSTKQKDDETGITLEISEGTIQKESIASLNNGTDITVRDLFFNVPARQKFLKSRDTEWRAILHLFQAFCLAYTQVSFKLFHDDRQIYAMPATNDLKERTSHIFEPKFSKNALSFELSSDRLNMKVIGICSDPQYVRFDRSHIFMFVLQRWVKNHKLMNAFIKGYQQMLPPQRYPMGALFITIDPQYVDINVHPRKEEVQFLHPKLIEDLIEDAIHQALQNAQSSKFTKKESLDVPRTTDVRPAEPMVSIKPAAPLLHHHSEPLPFYTQERKTDEFIAVVDSVFSKPVERPVVEPVKQNMLLDYKLLGQFKLTYILIEVENGLLLIDQHAAHERIMYERLRATLNNTEKIQLLFPQVIHLNASDVSLFEPFIPLLASFGIDAQLMSEQEIMVTHTPVYLKNQSVEDSIKQVLSVLHEYQYLDKEDLQKIIQERVHAQLSCKAAVRAGDELSQEGMHEIVKELSTSENRLTCPHGRPTLWEFAMGDIEKKFKRDYRS